MFAMSVKWLVVMQCFVLALTYSCRSEVFAGNCKFYVESQNEDCSNFTLSSCRWTYFYDDIVDNKTIYKWKYMQSANWSYCLQKCCYFSDREQTYFTLQDCTSHYQYTSTLMTYVICVFSIAGGITFLVFCYLGIRSCWQINWIDTSKQVLRQALETQCAICLNKKTTIRLDCRHFFHRHCIIEWSARKNVCPLCISSISGPVTAICQKCFKKSAWIIVLQNIDDLSEKLLCESCTNVTS